MSPRCCYVCAIREAHPVHYSIGHMVYGLISGFSWWSIRGWVRRGEDNA